MIADSLQSSMNQSSMLQSSIVNKKRAPFGRPPALQPFQLIIEGSSFCGSVN